MPDSIDSDRRFRSQPEVPRLLQEDIDPLEIELSRAELQRLRRKLKSHMLRHYLEVAELNITGLTEVGPPSSVNRPLIMLSAG